MIILLSEDEVNAEGDQPDFSKSTAEAIAAVWKAPDMDPELVYPQGTPVEQKKRVELHIEEQYG